MRDISQEDVGEVGDADAAESVPDVVRIVVNTPDVYKTSTNNISINTTINVICWQIDLVG